jgi:hypothetical protein
MIFSNTPKKVVFFKKTTGKVNSVGIVSFKRAFSKFILKYLEYNVTRGKYRLK